MECRARKSQSDPRVAMYGRPNRGSRSKSRRMLYGEYVVNARDVVEMKSHVDFILRVVGDLVHLGLRRGNAQKQSGR